MGRPAAFSEAQLLAVAAKVFRQKSFAAATVRDIALAAGIHPGSLHYHFRTKDELLLRMMERSVEALTAGVRKAVSVTDDPIQRVHLGLRAHMRLLLGGDDALYVILYDWRSMQGASRAAMVKLRDRYEAFWDRLLRAAVATGLGRKNLDVKLLRLFGFGALNWSAQWYREGGDRTPEQIADAYFLFLAFGLMAERKRPADVDALFEALLVPPKQKPKPKGARRVPLQAAR